jgi:hypothetical protein
VETLSCAIWYCGVEVEVGVEVEQHGDQNQQGQPLEWTRWCDNSVRPSLGDHFGGQSHRKPPHATTIEREGFSTSIIILGAESGFRRDGGTAARDEHRAAKRQLQQVFHVNHALVPDDLG